MEVLVEGLEIPLVLLSHRILVTLERDRGSVAWLLRKLFRNPGQTVDSGGGGEAVAVGDAGRDGDVESTVGRQDKRGSFQEEAYNFVQGCRKFGVEESVANALETFFGGLEGLAEAGHFFNSGLINGVSVGHVEVRHNRGDLRLDPIAGALDDSSVFRALEFNFNGARCGTGVEEARVRRTSICCGEGPKIETIDRRDLRAQDESVGVS